MTHIISKDILTAVMVNKGLPGLMSGESTHDDAVSFTYCLVASGAPDPLIEDLVIAALPATYSGNTLDELPGMITSAREKLGQDNDEAGASSGAHEKSTITQRAVETVLEQATLFHDEKRRGYISAPTPSGGRRFYSLDSKNANLFIRERHHRTGEKPLSRNSLAEVIETLKARAVFDSPEMMVCRRVARVGDEVFIDLGTDGGEVVRITAAGWSIVMVAPVAFIRDDGFKPLPEPALCSIKPGIIEELFATLGIAGDNTILLTGFLLNCLRGEGPFMCLIIEGQQGSGKTFLSELLKRILDPNAIARSRLPDNEPDLMLQAGTYFLPVYDNTSGMKADLSDALSQIAMGGSTSKRELYTNDELHVLSACRPLIINGIGDFVTRPDLLDRAIPIQLEPILERRSEADLRLEIEAVMPAVLATLYMAVAKALSGREVMPPEVADLRMIDSARWITTAEPALGFEIGTFARTLKRKQSETASELVNNEPIVGGLRLVIEDQPFIGTVLELFSICCAHRYTAGLPQTPVNLSKHLKRLAPALKPTGLHVRFEEKTKVGRLVRIWKDGQDPGQAKPSRLQF